MNRDFELLDESTMDVEDLQAERDLQLAAVDAIRRARRFGTFYVIRENEKIKKIPPDETGPNEERLLASAARLDRRIAELRSQEQT
jgi:hypothetical protein